MSLSTRIVARSGNGFNSHPVPCTSAKAAVKVIKVEASTDATATCPAGTTGVELFYPGVTHLHIECVAPVTHSG